MNELKKKNSKLFTLQLDEEARGQLDALAKKSGLSKSAVIRYALTVLFERELRNELGRTKR
jgi:predicted transcriptional regulator